MTAATPNAAKPKCRWYQSGLRTLLIGMALGGGGLEWLGLAAQKAVQADDAKGKPPTGPTTAREAIAELEKKGAIFEKDGDGNITGLHIGGDGITNDTLLCFNRLPQLQKVEIRCAKNVNDEALARLGELAGLKTLWLEYVPITGQGMRHLSKLKHLEDLFLGPYKSNFADDGLDYLKDIKSLRTLTFTGNAHVSDKAVNRLRTELPNCKIERRREIEE